MLHGKLNVLRTEIARPGEAQNEHPSSGISIGVHGGQSFNLCAVAPVKLHLTNLLD